MCVYIRVRKEKEQKMGEGRREAKHNPIHKVEKKKPSRLYHISSKHNLGFSVSHFSSFQILVNHGFVSIKIKKWENQKHEKK